MLKILLHQPHKQKIGQHHLRAGGGDRSATRGLLFRNGVQAQRCLLLKRVGVKASDRQDLASYPQRFTGRHIDLASFTGIGDGQQQIVRRHRLYRRQQGVHILF